MTLIETFDAVSPSVVAFISKTSLGEAGGQPIAPIIFGTGFLVHDDGIVATNRHVIDHFQNIQGPPGSFGVAVILFIPGKTEQGAASYRWAIVDIKGFTTLDEFNSSETWFGESVPDIGFVQLRVCGTPSLPLAHEDFYLRPGMPIATAGFPLGEAPLTVMEKLNQLTPSVRRGIVSSVYPFSIRHPHGFTIDVMQQGGQAGRQLLGSMSPLLLV